MPRKGMRSLCFSVKDSSSSSTPPPASDFSSPSRFGFSPSRLTFSDSVMDRTLEMAEPIIKKWDAESTAFGAVTSLFYENRGREARSYIKWVNNLQKAMHFVVTENSGSEKLVRAQSLMEMAMKRLQKEFYQILSMNRAHLDPESVSTRSSMTSIRSSSTTSAGYDYEDDDVIKEADDFIADVEDASTAAMADLKLIADCMISSGYAKECVKIYNIIRKSIIDEGIYRLGVEKFTASQIHRMKWEVLDGKIKDWLHAVGTAVRTLFNGERILCDHVFASSDSIKESCFTEISREGAMILFGFPENVAKNSKKSPEKVFRALDLYTGISLHWQEIEFIFSFNSAASIKSQAMTSLISLGDFVRAAVSEFESAIQKYPTKDTVAGAGIHSQTIQAMDFMTLLADYSNILSDMLQDSPPMTMNSFPELFFAFSDSLETAAPPISVKMAWLIMVLLCKLDARSKHYKDVSLSYLFLANNLQYVVVKVRTSNLQYILGEEWIAKQEAKVKQYASSYEQTGWCHVMETIPSNPTAVSNPEKVKEIFRKFSSSFDIAYRKQSSCVVRDGNLRDEIKVSIAIKILSSYRAFYDAHKAKMEKKNSSSVVRFAPEDVEKRLSDLFFGHV